MAFFFFNNHHGGVSVGMLSLGMGICASLYHLKLTGSLCATNIAARRSAMFTPFTSAYKWGVIVFEIVIKGAAASYCLGALFFKSFSSRSKLAVLNFCPLVKSARELPSPIIN